MGRDRIEHAALITTVSLLLSGCVPVPMSHEWPTRLTQDQLTSIHAGAATRTEVEALLGTADLHRENGRYWVYDWSEEHGQWVIVPAAPMAGTNTGVPVYSTFHAVFIEFDEAGVVVSAGRGARQGKTLRFCNAQGACVEHWDLNCMNVETLGFTPEPFCNPAAGRPDQSMGLDDVMSSFTLPAAHDTEAVTALGSADCRLVLSVATGVPDDGIEFLVDGLWPEKLWLPKDAVAVIDLPAGVHQLGGCGDTRAAVECRAGETLQLALGDSRKRQQRCAGEVLPVSRLAEGARLAGIAGKRRVLLPDRSVQVESADEQAQP